MFRYLAVKNTVIGLISKPETDGKLEEIEHIFSSV